MSEFQIDDRQILDLFKDLSPKKQKAAHRNALKKSARILVNRAKKNLQDETGKAKSKNTNIKNRWHFKKSKSGKITFQSLQDGIKMKVDSNAESAKVHIMGDFRLKWFELGTKERYTKKKRYRGSMKATYFFKKAKESTETEIQNTLQENLRQSILRAAK